jgi:hypothetical protein
MNAVWAPFKVEWCSWSVSSVPKTENQQPAAGLIGVSGVQASLTTVLSNEQGLVVAQLLCKVHDLLRLAFLDLKPEYLLRHLQRLRCKRGLAAGSTPTST